jgi:sugar O-acyltransferase (sialic acid O-acetyltransferase NeuD family)
VKKKQILLIGGGGHCKSCIDVIESTNEFEIAGVVDVKSNFGKTVLGYKVIGCDDDLPELKKQYNYAIVTIGQIKDPEFRKNMFHKLKKIGYKTPVIISSNSYVSKHSRIGEGTIIMHHVVVNAGVIIGKNNIINTKALIEHDIIIGNNCHISTNAVLNGNIKIGNDCFIGSNAVLINGVFIKDRINIGMKAMVIRSLNESGTYVGKLLKKIK